MFFNAFGARRHPEAIDSRCSRTNGGRLFLDMLLLPMPLTPVQRPGIETPAGVNFGMMHGGTSIRVVVAREVLQDGSDDRASLLARFERYRRWTPPSKWDSSKCTDMIARCGAPK